MDLLRIVANSLARRISAALVVLVLATFGIRSAHAQASCSFPTEGEAYAAALDAAQRCAAAKGAGWSPKTTRFNHNICAGQWQGVAQSGGGEAGCSGIQASYTWGAGGGCANKPTQTTLFMPITGSTRCNLNCVFTYSQNSDDTSRASPTGATCGDDYSKKCPSGSYWNGYMSVCEPIDQPCPPTQKKVDGKCVPDGKCPEGMVATQGSTPGAVQQGSLYCKPAENECPAGNVKSPTGQCLPGEGQCAAGEAKRENGTCGKDKDGDGKADEDDDDSENDPKKDSASGGDSCDTPPSCSGNAIACMQVKIQWRIDCNTRRQVNINGGTCDAVPICTGKGCNAMEYAQLMQQWRTSCAVEKLAAKSGETAGPVGDANKNGVADVLEGTGNVADPGDGASDVAGAKRFGIGVSTDRLNKENIFGSGSCPEPPTFQIMGFSVANDFPYWCQAMAILRALVLMFGAYYALKILIGGVA